MNARLLSILICTCDREERLSQTLQSLGKVDIPAGLQIEVVIVDGGSSNRVQQLLERALPPAFPFKYIHEPVRGLSRARNRAIAESSGDILLFTDDDLRFPADWLLEMCAPILRGEKDAVGGGVEMAPNLIRPWMALSHRGWLACTGRLWADAPPELVTLITASMAFSRAVLAKVPGFDEEIGGGALGCHEDTLFSWQLREAGARMCFVDVAVEHHFDEERLLRVKFLDAARRMGRASAYIVWHWDHKRIRLPLLQSFFASSRLSLHHALHMSADPRAEGCSEAEMALEHQAAFFRQYLVERRRPHNYSRHGLLKRAGV